MLSAISVIVSVSVRFKADPFRADILVARLEVTASVRDRRSVEFVPV